MNENKEAYEYLQKVHEAVWRIREPPKKPFGGVRVDWDWEGEEKKGIILWDEDLKKFVIDEHGIIYPLEGFDFPKEGGVLVYWQGIEYPTKVFPYKETVEKVDDVKKVGMAFVRSFTDALKRNPVGLGISVILLRKDIEVLLKNVLQELHQILRDVQNRPEMFSPVTREVHRVFSLKNGKVRNQIRDLFCHALDYDDYYRYLWQDVIVFLDKKNLREHPIRELRRMFDVLASRETEDSTIMRVKWRRFKKMMFLLYFRKDILREIQEFLLELRLQKMKMDKIDRYHAGKKVNVQWSFQKNKKVVEKDK